MKNNRTVKLIDLLGDNARVSQVEGEKIASCECEDYLVETYSLKLNSIEKVPAYCIRPLVKSSNPMPVVLYQHSHGGDFSLGKSECITGTSYLQSPNFAKSITDLGAVVWAIDAWGFEERGGISESELYKEFLVTGKTLWGMRLFDCMALIDYLETREDMDTNRLATIGMSMGGLLSWWLAAIDYRVKVCIDIAAQVDIETLIQQRRLDHHGFYYYVPNLLKYYSTIDIQKMICPRPRMSLVGSNDTMCFYSGVEKINRELRIAYESVDIVDNFIGLSLTGGHQETSMMRSKWQEFLKEHL